MESDLDPEELQTDQQQKGPIIDERSVPVLVDEPGIEVLNV